MLADLRPFPSLRRSRPIAALIEINPDGAAADHADADGSPYRGAASRTIPASAIEGILGVGMADSAAAKP
jgi:hypothetical protein